MKAIITKKGKDTVNKFIEKYKALYERAKLDEKVNLEILFLCIIVLWIMDFMKLSGLL